MKTKAELNALKEEFETLNKKPAELSEDELLQVNAGATTDEIIKKMEEYMRSVDRSEQEWTVYKKFMDEMNKSNFKCCKAYMKRFLPEFPQFQFLYDLIPSDIR